MKQMKSDLPIVIVLILLSFALYLVHFLIFHDMHHITLFALEDLAFVPIEVISITLIFHRILAMNEKKSASASYT